MATATEGPNVTVDPLQANVWMVGGGIASMAAAAFLIRDAGVPGENIHILETLDVPGGSLDGAESPSSPVT
jgi:oleate hydratase